MVECQLPKLKVASSILVARSNFQVINGPEIAISSNSFPDHTLSHGTQNLRQACVKVIAARNLSKIRAAMKAIFYCV